MPDSTSKNSSGASYPEDLDSPLDTDLRVYEGGRVADEFVEHAQDKRGRCVLAASRSDAEAKLRERIDSPPETVQIAGSRSATPERVVTALLDDESRPDDLSNESDAVLEAVARALERRTAHQTGPDPQEVAAEIRSLKTADQEDA